MNHKHTLVIGASPKEDRYSNRAVKHLVTYGHPVVAVGLREGMIDTTPILTRIPDDVVIDTVTLYLNAHNQEAWRERILGLRPKRIIFNPGAENPALSKEAKALGVEVLDACTLVMLATGQY